MTTINTNIGSIQAQSNMTRANGDFNQAMTRLSSGMRINAAKDDAAGMAIAEKMTSQIRGLNQAVRNATDGKNLVDTTEGAHVEVSNMLQRLRELSVQSANDTNTSSNRNNLTAEGKQLIAEINAVAQNTTFNGMKLLDGSFSGKQLQIGADMGQTLELNVDSAAATDIGANVIRSEAAAAAAVDQTANGGDTIDSALAPTTLTLTGFAGSKGVTISGGMSAAEAASEVNNASSATGIEATAITKVEIRAFQEGETVSFKIGTKEDNVVDIGIVSITDAKDVRNLRDAINAVSGQTGITATMAELDNSRIVLTDANGDDIIIQDAATAGGFELDTDLTETDPLAAGDVSVADGTTNVVTGTVEFSSSKSFSVTDSADSFVTDTEGSKLEDVASIDLSTADGAAAAIKVIDTALQKISQSRSDLGAVSNRLDSTISNLTNITVNVEAARSGVMDADFAKESTALARGQILAQAATAMLAQANSSQQNVMSLLR